MSNNVLACFPGTAPVMGAVLNAAAPTMVGGPKYCQWQCDCGAGDETIRIDNDDGLPVELLEFDVDGS